MNIEEDLTSLKEIVAIRKERCDGFIESDGCLISTKRLETLLTAYEKEKEKNNSIEEYEKECKQVRAFCRRIRRDEKRNVDEFNQGREFMCLQFLNLINGELHWTYEGKYFDIVDKEMEEIKQC